MHTKRCSQFTFCALLAIVSTGARAETINIRFTCQGSLTPVPRPVPMGYTPVEAAVRALLTGPTAQEAAAGISSYIPAGTQLLSLDLNGEEITINLSPEVLNGLDEYQLQQIFTQFHSTLGDFEGILSIRLICQGGLLSSYLPPTPVVQPARLNRSEPRGLTGSLSGRNITIGPSHGRFWNGSGWYWQRSDPCGFGEAVLEDTNSIRLCQFLYQYLTQDGATVHVPRELDEANCCNSDTGLPWWKMAARYWLEFNGIPSWVWDSSTDDESDDIRARPLYADYCGSDIYVSCHTNAGGGGTGSGTETYRDTEMEHPAHEANSYNLAINVQYRVVSAIREMYDAVWSDRGVKDSQGGFGEIRIPDRPACMIELAFHDNCTRDALYLTDNFFRSVAEWGLYKGICEYFGATPTWDRYSDEFVSDTIPTTMCQGQVYNVSVTFRNRGVLWTTARSFRLGAVGNSDPFTSFNRVDISGEVRPGNTYTFNFQMTAPGPGDYVSDWRMIRDGYQWFGAILTKNIHVETAPPPPTICLANPDTICAGGSSTLSATPGSGGDTVEWFTDSCGGTLVPGGASPAVNPTTTTTYYARTKNTSTGCVSGTCCQVTVTVNPSVPGDFDHDCDVDNVDFGFFDLCYSGPQVPRTGGCEGKDLDNDGDVDQMDFAIFQRCYSGENIPADPNCAN